MVGDRGAFPSIGGLSPFPVKDTSLSLDFSGFRMGVGGASLFFGTFFSLAVENGRKEVNIWLIVNKPQHDHMLDKNLLTQESCQTKTVLLLPKIPFL